MGMGMCLNCEHCEPTRTNDLDQVRCKLFHTYVDPSDRCKRYNMWRPTLKPDDFSSNDERRCDDVK